MSVDTRAKRLSMLNFGSDVLLPDPSGTVDQAARQTFLNMYSGILFTLPSAITTPDGRIVVLLAENRTVAVNTEDRTVIVSDPG